MLTTLQQKKKALDHLCAQTILNEFNLSELKIVIENDSLLSIRLGALGQLEEMFMSDEYTLKEFQKVLVDIHKVYQEAQSKLQKVDDIYGF